MRRGNASLACAVSKLRFRAFPGLGDRSPWRREVQGVVKREVPGDCDSYADPTGIPSQRSGTADRACRSELGWGCPGFPQGSRGRCEQRAGDAQEASFR